jgi:GntR family transcriptional regulator
MIDYKNRLHVDRGSGIPLHIQVKDIIKELITEGKIGQEDNTITESFLQAQFGVSRNTIRQAIASLSDAGVLRRERAKGIIINPESQQLIRETINGLSFTEAAIKRGMQPKSILTDFKITEDTSLLSTLFSVREEGSFFEVTRIRYLNAAPVCIIHSFIPERIAPELKSEDFTETGNTQSLFYILEKFYNVSISMWIENIEPILIPSGPAKLLKTKSGRPGFLRKDTFYSDKQLVVAYQKTITNEKYRLEGLIFKRER